MAMYMFALMHENKRLKLRTMCYENIFHIGVNELLSAHLADRLKRPYMEINP